MAIIKKDDPPLKTVLAEPLKQIPANAYPFLTTGFFFL